MNTTETEPTRPQRFAGAAIALIISIGALVATLLILEASGVDERTTLFVSKAFTYSCLGVAMIGWKWPQTVFAPFKRLLASVVSASKNSTEIIQDEASTTQSGIKISLRTPMVLLTISEIHSSRRSLLGLNLAGGGTQSLSGMTGQSCPR